MSLTARKDWEQAWVDDYLDLLNMAKRLQDTQWEQELLQTLQEYKRHTAAEIHYRFTQELWRRFDEINRRMLELYEKLKANRDQQENRLLQEQVWDLKLERIEVMRRIHSGENGIPAQ
ncbi:hypothetical protein [Paenibacillus mucilaginosus]|uniref:Uncharacterized protein n=3 Tax=Paenibacillus mucilaginosus TaxID=61624 RepID=H6NJH9_9BACL|nr:hypothetical protein [Paenibacillus mucilaginosus]AEI41087.1 hypothetical protein KNP414_02526 [Paenibacillus mucilaginosus KNP414]AFC29659.1 hypothetical protein PM3016_2783 [Paenibacillus mucilaginosus 3016]AFH61834.1 hypothetical protein B2K_14100 [Paenibacillus mucilaginosus K02]MCG7211473.1 hypothetical protein [Paenibacillus mucilaginosus]WDM30152.1 hypothetical protein KCX80_13825 [Paenibacillus mucilaginosus]